MSEIEAALITQRCVVDQYFWSISNRFVNDDKLTSEKRARAAQYWKCFSIIIIVKGFAFW